MNRVNLGNKTPKGYRVSIGYYVKDGQRKQRQFWLGHDPVEARRKIAEIDALYGRIPPQKGKCGRMIRSQKQHQSLAVELIAQPSTPRKSYDISALRATLLKIKSYANG